MVRVNDIRFDIGHVAFDGPDDLQEGNRVEPLVRERFQPQVRTKQLRRLACGTMKAPHVVRVVFLPGAHSLTEDQYLHTVATLGVKGECPSASENLIIRMCRDYQDASQVGPPR